VSPSLSVVGVDAKGQAARPAETVGGRIRRLQAEAKLLAKDHVAALGSAMADLGQLADEIANGGDAYAPGIRDLARRLSEELETRAQTLDALNART
jgi:hypothetical protein